MKNNIFKLSFTLKKTFFFYLLPYYLFLVQMTIHQTQLINIKVLGQEYTLVLKIMELGLQS